MQCAVLILVILQGDTTQLSRALPCCTVVMKNTVLLEYGHAGCKPSSPSPSPSPTATIVLSVIQTIELSWLLFAG